MIKCLLRAIEQKTNLQMKQNHEFTELSDRIFDTLHERVSPSTLKRLWNYVNPLGVRPRTSTLNILARLLGFRSFEDFCRMGGVMENVKEQSTISFAPFWISKELERDARVVVRWKPNRRCVLRHVEENLFEVVEAENCKISVGDTFECHTLMQGQAMQVYNLTHEGKGGFAYVAGKVDGVTYEID